MACENNDAHPAPDLRAALDAIEDILIAANEGLRNRIIDVLTALRGPDLGPLYRSDRELIKRGGTNYIRVAAFPRLLANNNYDSATGYSPVDRWDISRNTQRIDSDAIDNEHIRAHIHNAYVALGWED